MLQPNNFYYDNDEKFRTLGKTEKYQSYQRITDIQVLFWNPKVLTDLSPYQYYYWYLQLFNGKKNKKIHLIIPFKWFKISSSWFKRSWFHLLYLYFIAEKKNIFCLHNWIYLNFWTKTDYSFSWCYIWTIWTHHDILFKLHLCNLLFLLSLSAS